MKEIIVPYGKDYQNAIVNDDIDVGVIDVKETNEYYDEESMLKDALDNPINSQRLENLISTDDKVLIVVNDHTRPGPNKLIVKEILKRLHSKDLSKNQIKIIIAAGSHRASTKEELINMLGDYIVNNYEIINHDCKDDSQLSYVDRKSVV